MTPPPINVIQTDSGRLKMLDHRRLLAAKLIGRPTIRTIVWWSTRPQRDGGTSALTYELTRQGERALKARPARPDHTFHADDRAAPDEAKQRRRHGRRGTDTEGGGPTSTSTAIADAAGGSRSRASLKLM